MNYTYLIEKAAAEFVLTRNKRDRRVLMDTFHDLALHPNQTPDFSESVARGRELHTKFVGPFSVTYWIDHAVVGVRIGVREN